MTSDSRDHHPPGPAPAVFQTTRWSIVLRAGDSREEIAQDALSSLCRDYWKPLYHFARRKGSAPEDAQDLAQGFFASLLQSASFSRADRSLGRFRTFLMGAFTHYMATTHRDQSAQKRGGGQKPLSLDDPNVEVRYLAQEEMTPERFYERSWALELLDRATKQLRAEYADAGRLPVFEALRPHLVEGGGRPGHARLSEELGLTENALMVALHRMRKRYGQLVRAEIAETVESEGEIEDELRHLISVVS